MTQVNTNSNSKYLKLLSALIFLCFAYGFSNAQDSTNVFEKIKKFELLNAKNKASWDEKNNSVDYYLQVAKETDGAVAADNANKGLNMAFAVKSHPAVFKAALTNGDIYFNNRDYTSAIKCYNYCLDALNNEHKNYPKVELPKSKKKNKDEPVSYVAMQESIAKNKYKVNIKLAKCYSLTNETGLELPSLNNALEAAEKNTVDAIAVYEMMVEYYKRQKDYSIAIDRQKLIVTFFKGKDARKYTLACEELGDLYSEINNWDLAEKTFRLPITILNNKADGDLKCQLYTKLYVNENKKKRNNPFKYYKKDMEKYCAVNGDTIIKDTTDADGEKDTIDIDDNNEFQRQELEKKISDIKTNLFETQKKYDTERKKGNLKEANRLSKALQKLDEEKALAELDLSKIVDDLQLEIDIKDALILQSKLKDKDRINELQADSLRRANDEKQRFIDNERRENEQETRVKYLAVVLSIVVLSGLIIGYQYRKRKEDEAERQRQKHIEEKDLQKQKFIEEEERQKQKHSEEAERLKRINVQTEMKALRSQMNPHFIFNALQSIQHFLSKHKSKDASEYLVKFGKLMRMVLEYSRESEVSIQQERDALELYMELESVRQPFKFSFEFDESVSMEDDELPPLILQPFVENAIKHGLKTKKKGGHIKIEGRRINDELIFAVEDNGIGREASKSMQQTTASFKKQSLGMKLTEERLAVLNETKKINAHYRIIDLYDNNNNATGTRVELIIPQTS